MKDNCHMFQHKLNKNILIFALLTLVLAFFAFSPEIVLASGKGAVGGNLANSIEGATKNIKASVNLTQMFSLLFAFIVAFVFAYILYKRHKQNAQQVGAGGIVAMICCILVAAGSGKFINYIQTGFYGDNATVVKPEDQIFKD